MYFTAYYTVTTPAKNWDKSLKTAVGLAHYLLLDTMIMMILTISDRIRSVDSPLLLKRAEKQRGEMGESILFHPEKKVFICEMSLFYQNINIRYNQQ